MLKTILFSAIVLLIIGFLIAHFFAPYTIIKRTRDTLQNRQTPADFGLVYEKIVITTIDSLQLTGLYVPTSLDTALATIILLHGIGGCKENVLELAAQLSKSGYNCFALDSRAHGESEGEYITYGYFEKHDVSKVIDFLEHEKGLQKIGVRGASMGGAIALLSLEQDKRLKFGIIESTFSDLEQVVFDYQKRLSGISSRFLSNNALRRAAIIANFKPEEVKPVVSAKNVHQPIFYAHGDADESIPMKYGKLIFKNLASKQKEFVVVNGAGHENVQEIGGVQFLEKILKFLRKI